MRPRTIKPQFLPLSAALLAASAGLFLLQPMAPGLAAGVPSSQELNFTILRDGDEVGSHVIRFDGQADNLEVDIATDVAVKLPLVGITVYHFKHRGHELWTDGALQELDSTTDDDGTEHALSVERRSNDLIVKSDVTDATYEGSIVPASLWNDALLQRASLLNTLDGSEMAVTVSDLGMDKIQRHGRTVEAHHYKIDGELNREVWYDPEGVLVQVRFAAKDDSEIQYVLE
ncbi:MAG: DUF6134 family protein [Limibacillus sp.]|jgi:hypothetical protein